MQGDPLSPTIFNVVVDAVVRHWVMGVIVGVEERRERGKEGRHQAALFYADNVMVSSYDPGGSRVLSTPWSACLTGLACGPISGRHSAWYSAPSRRMGICWRRRTGEGSRGRPHIQGATEGTGLMQGVRGVDGGGIPGELSND